MVVRMVIAGESQSDTFAEVCLVADYLNQKLPHFCYARIVKPVLEWKEWLCKINVKNGWHHLESPLVWKELLMKGSKPYYIGGASEFLEYCHSYYNFDIFISPRKFEGLIKNYTQYKKKVKIESDELGKNNDLWGDDLLESGYVVCISGAANPLTMHLVSSLLEMSGEGKHISKIYLYDKHDCGNFLEGVEAECNYIGVSCPAKVVKYVSKIGIALTFSNLLIVLDHVPFDDKMPIGTWLNLNKEIMLELGVMINASGPRSLYVIFPNIGPACYNATCLAHAMSPSFNKYHIMVATSDLGLDILFDLAETCKVPPRGMFCPPVWGFVGINHLVDIRTTMHKYNTFEPYRRYTKVRNSTLTIGTLTPEVRTMEYLVYFDNNFWLKIAGNKEKRTNYPISINKATSVINLISTLFFNHDPDYVLNVGVMCDGSFGLTFDGIFSQPSRFVDNAFKPATDYLLPRDSQMKLPYLQSIAEKMMNLEAEDLPPIVPLYPCPCKPKTISRKNIWY